MIPLLALLALPRIAWQSGPAQVDLPGHTCSIPPGVVYVQGEEMRRFLTAAGNPLRGGEMLVVGPETLDWFAVAGFRAEPLAGRLTWTQEHIEPDGRRTANWYLSLPAGGGRLEIELISNPGDLPRHKAALEAMLAPRGTAWAGPAFMGLIALLAIGIWKLRRW